MKKIAKIFVLTCVMFVMSGCMKMKVGIDIIDDETATMTMTVLMEEELLDDDTYGYGDPFEDLLETYEDMDADIEEIEEEFDGDTYIGYEITVDDEDAMEGFFDNLEVDDEDGKEVYTLTLDFEDMTSSMGDMGSGYSSDYYDETSIKQMKKLGVEMEISITMPYNISDASYGDVDGKTVTIDLLELMVDGEDEIEIIAEEGGGSFLSGNTLLYAAIAIVVVAGGVIAFILVMNKKNKNGAIPEDMNNEPITQEPIDREPLVPTTDDTTTEEVVEETPEVTETTDEVTTEDVVEETPEVTETTDEVTTEEVVDETPEVAETTDEEKEENTDN
ncbi:MAG: hypothetical protein ACK5LC_14590 [Coprobacillaceae bacterium]